MSNNTAFLLNIFILTCMELEVYAVSIHHYVNWLSSSADAVVSKLQPARLTVRLHKSSSRVGDLLLLSPDPLEPPHAVQAILHYER